MALLCLKHFNDVKQNDMMSAICLQATWRQGQWRANRGVGSLWDAGAGQDRVTGAGGMLHHFASTKTSP